MDDHTDTGSTFLDEDYDFDFDAPFGDIAEPAPSRTGRLPKVTRPAKPKGPYRPKRLDNANWQRIAVAGFVGFIGILIMYLIVHSVVQHHKQSAYARYATATQTIAQQSADVGNELESLLTQPTGQDKSQLISHMDQLDQRQQSITKQAQDTSAPGPMGPAQTWLVTSMQYRDNCLGGMERALTSALGTTSQSSAAASFASAAQRCVASDAIYTDSFQPTARAILGKQGITGQTIADSDFVGGGSTGANLEFDSGKNATLTLQRLGTGVSPTKKFIPDGKTHGVDVGSGVAMAGVDLTEGTTATVKGSSSVSITVPVENSGQGQETQVPVKVVIGGAGTSSQTLNATVPSIDPGQTENATVPLTQTPKFGVPLTVTVSVGPVPGEQNLSNNTATYRVMFQL